MVGCILLYGNRAYADPVVVYYSEGVSHGFLVLRSMDGKILAAGDMIQVVKGERVTTETRFRFRDGSLHDEVTVFSQDNVFRLVSDHLIQKGASFPKPIDIMIDASKNEIAIHALNKGKEKDEIQHIDLPEDLANGMMLTLLKNISPTSPQTIVSMLSTSSKPKLVKLRITPSGARDFTFAGFTRTAVDFDIHVEIGGISGAVAPLLGKEPPDMHIWMSSGTPRTFVRFEGPLYTDGPIWEVDLAAVRVSDHDITSAPGKK
jgi:hypothetical protein